MNFSSQQNQSGSVLVYVLVLVVIAGFIAASYLAFVDDQRTRTARNLNQDGLRISTEQALLNLETTIRSELLRTGEVDLTRLNSTETPSGLSLNLSSKTDSGSDHVQVQPFASPAEYEKIDPPLANQDLFGQAKALVTLIDVDITTSSTVSNPRLPDLSITDHPQIAVREIPVSQFTVFSAGGSFTLGTPVFGQDIGRVFSESTLSVSGNFSSEFPVVAGQNVNFQGGSLQINNPSSKSASVSLSTDTQNSTFLQDARTSLDSRIVTGSVLPIGSATLNSVYSSGQSASNGLNVFFLEKQCDVWAVAQPDTPITAPNGQKEFFVNVGGRDGSRSMAYKQGGTISKNQGTVSSQTVVFAAAQSKQNPRQTILSLDYAQLDGAQFGSVYVMVLDPRTGNPAGNAVILIRGAQTLNGPLSIVSPHPIVVAGDFNDGGEAASIITPANLQTVPENWGSDVFGNYK